MKKLPFYEVKAIRRAENTDKDIVTLTDGSLMIYEFVSRAAFQRIRRMDDYDVIGYLTHGDDTERVYTIFEMSWDLEQNITPGFYPPRDDN